MKEFDFLVIGAGSGLDVANVAANQDQSVAVVEKGPLGGTCLNRGCVPSKKLLYHAEIVETIDRVKQAYEQQRETEDGDGAQSSLAGKRALASIERVSDDLQANVEQFEEREDALRERFQQVTN